MVRQKSGLKSGAPLQRASGYTFWSAGTLIQRKCDLSLLPYAVPAHSTSLQSKSVHQSHPYSHAALKSELTSTLETADVPAMIIDRVQSFACPLLPFVRGPAGKKKLHDIGTSPSKHVSSNIAMSASKLLCQSIQNLWFAETKSTSPLRTLQLHHLVPFELTSRPHKLKLSYPPKQH
ncbi:hypothetical protein DEU56DRAFT_908189 [Suillus clintonianus]|uniref:uncharacterized protein n=1 Tax=Suillus clintonianus TaxID=1904413 RepID=UPI001B87A0FF|nr:uncharacterized protein DEU56DRAFT_908189 [Suillus clintonianus]KAG2151332.1 hypothetical protein DEU56DRAFT_908189 [Suillus clintonianus]